MPTNLNLNTTTAAALNFQKSAPTNASGTHSLRATERQAGSGCTGS